MGGSALTAERQLRRSSLTNVTARKWWASEEEERERETWKAEVPFDHPEQPGINQNIDASKAFF